MNSKSFEEVKNRFDEIKFNEKFDIIVAIANGGLIPAAMINQQLNIDFQVIKLNLRNNSQQQLYPAPILLEPIKFDFIGKNILLVEDRIKTGLTINYAKELLKGAAIIKTFAVNGKADYCLYDQMCFKFPWIR